MKKINSLAALILSTTFTLALNTYAEESTLEKAETQKNKAVDSVKSNYRDAKDKTCKMIDGKMQCLGKKLTNKARSAADKAKTDAKELENKID